MKRRAHPWGIIIVRPSDPGGVRIPVSVVVILSRLNPVRLGLGINSIPLIFSAVMIGAWHHLWYVCMMRRNAIWPLLRGCYVD